MIISRILAAVLAHRSTAKHLARSAHFEQRISIERLFPKRFTCPGDDNRHRKCFAVIAIVGRTGGDVIHHAV